MIQSRGIRTAYSYSLLLSGLIAFPLYDLYWDIVLTKYYLIALHENKMISICPKNHENALHQVDISDENSLLQTVILPPFFECSAKSLSGHSNCLILHQHHEGFLPGSFILKSPLYQIQWIVSYSGRLSYRYDLHVT